MARKELKCATCQYYFGKECTHDSNIGIKIRNRKEYDFYINAAKDIEKSCKNYKENDI